jgi:hypothetical protein
MVDKAEVLPAYGQALAELVTPTPEESYDREVNPESRVQGIWETPSQKLYRPVPPIHRRESHRLRFFGRGSTRVFFLATLLDQENSTPIQIAQIGVAVLERREDGTITIPAGGVSSRIALALDTKELSDDLRKAIEGAMPEGYQLLATQSDSPLEQRLRGARVANRKMREMAREAAQATTRESSAFLVLGQSLGNEFITHAGPLLIGVNHEFHPGRQFVVGKTEYSLYRLLANLPAETRTAVFPREWEGHRGEIVSWYVRIRDHRGLDFPLAGVIRVELPNPRGEKVETDLVDDLSRHLVAERTVAPYGSGPGWHARLYPLHLAEEVVRGRFHSPEVVKASLRWKHPYLQRSTT